MVEAIILIVVLAVTVGILWLAKRQADLKPFQRSFTKQNYAIKTMEKDYNF